MVKFRILISESPAKNPFARKLFFQPLAKIYALVFLMPRNLNNQVKTWWYDHWLIKDDPLRTAKVCIRHPFSSLSLRIEMVVLPRISL